jgi:pSer/pThr/pTyr-binding forkhead associated (FHA) protein
VRFDDPTVSRRHALIHREGNAIRVMDDRSLNGVWVNGERVDWRELEDHDELTLGRFRLYLVRIGRTARVDATAA